MSKAEDTILSIPNDVGRDLSKSKKLSIFSKKNPKKNQNERPVSKHNSNQNNFLPKWYNEHRTNPAANAMDVERKPDTNVTNEIIQRNIDANLASTGVLTESSTTRFALFHLLVDSLKLKLIRVSCGCFGRMFGYLKRKLTRSGSSASKSKRARVKDKRTESNATACSSLESDQNNRNTEAVNDLTSIVIHKTTDAIPIQPTVNHDHSVPELIICEVNEVQDIKPVEKRKRNRRKKPLSNGTSNKKTSEMPEEIRNDPNLKKYWVNRYRLFSKYDEGIKLDAESWYSVTPEKISQEIARRCQCDVIIDAFCGAGGNTIQFAFVCERVIAIDIDPEKIKLAKNNAEIYGVADRIEFIVGDFFQVAPSLTADVVFLSPPWGGPNYKVVRDFKMSQIMEPYGGEHLYNVAKQISDHIAYFLPRNINATEISALEPGEYVKIDRNYLDNRLVAITAYFGELVEDYGDEWNE